MNKVWTTYELGAISTIHNGSTPSTKNEEYWNGDIIWITPKDLSNQKQKYIFKGERFITKKGLSKVKSKLLPKGTILLSSRAPIGLLSITQEELVTNQGFKNIIVNNSILYNEYLYYNLKLKKDELNNLGSGTTFKELSKSTLETFRINLPNISTQKSIAKVLSDLDAKLELNNKINQELEAMAKTLYDYWFVQFDFPANLQNSTLSEVEGYKSSGGKMVYNEELKRDIPVGWEVKRLINNMNVQYGFPYSTKLFNNDGNGTPVIRIRDILESTISLFSREKADEKYKIEKGDLLIGMDGNFHMNFWDKNNCYLNQRCVKIKPKDKSSISTFQALFDTQPYIKAREKNVSRTTVGHLSANDINGLNVLKPTDNIQLKANKIFNTTLDKILINRNENQHLTELRDWLLPMLMNGQVTVGEAEEKLSMAAEPQAEYKKG